MSDPIYFDHQATTPVDPRVFAEMLPYFTTIFGNPHATDHGAGRLAAAAVAAARGEIADLIGAAPREVVFTSGATEANNLLLRGAAKIAPPGRRQLVSARTEHKAVLEPLAELEAAGFRIDFAAVGSDGFVDLDHLRDLAGPETALISIMATNNEIGIEQPIGEIGAIAHSAGALFHCDAAQALGKRPLDVDAMGIDLMSVSAHKLYGPKGIGAAYIRRSLVKGFPHLIAGGGQEGGLRAGTLPTPLCVGFGAACRLAGAEMAQERDALIQHRDRLLDILRDARIDMAINGSLDRRWPGNLNISFAGVDAEALLMTVGERLAISSGSACTAEALEASHVVTALGFGAERSENAVRIGMGRYTTAEEVDRAADILIEAVRRLLPVSRSMLVGD